MNRDHFTFMGGQQFRGHGFVQPELSSRLGYEAMGVVESVGAEVRTVKAGDFVVMPFAFSNGTCAFCREGLQWSSSEVIP